MTRLKLRVFSVLTVAALGGLIVAAQPAGAGENSHAQHVLLISVDGLHQSDLTWYVSKHPDSVLAKLVHSGVSFTNAMTPFPSDSYPGIVGQVTGGNPVTTGVYYDDSYNHALLPPGTTDCKNATPGTEVTYFEAIAKDPTRLDSGQGLNGLPDSILNLSSNPRDLIDPAALPVDPNTCKGIYPNEYLLVNTIFEVAHAAGLRTAWSDKHAAYLIVAGPSGKGVDDFFTPEINSLASAAGSDWTKDNALTRQYDSYKVQAVINEINGWDHSGQHHVGTPAIFGLNFQTVSTAQKLPSGGYLSDGSTPSPLLAGALDYINSQVGAMQSALKRRGLAGNTTIILSAKHGQSPDDPNKLTRIKDSKVIKDINKAWNLAGHAGDLVAFSINDDGWLMWTAHGTQAEADFAKSFLQGYSSAVGDGSDGKAPATNITGDPKPYTSAGLQPAKIYAGADARNLISLGFSFATSNLPRVPDVIGIAQVGTVYTGGTGKIAEHGGNNEQDRHVPIVVSGAEVDGGKTVGTPVETTQIAPTILRLLGLDPNSLKAVVAEKTPTLSVN